MWPRAATIVREAALRAWSWALLLALAGAGAAQTWFRPGLVIATGDNFPSGLIRPEHSLAATRWIWETQVTATGGVDYYPTLQLFPSLFGEVCARLGCGPALAQRLFLTLLFAALAPAMLAFLRCLFPRPGDLPGIVAGSLLYAFNPTLFFVVPNAVYLTALALMPAAAALVVRGARSPGWVYPAALALLTFPLSFTFWNPPMFGLVIGSSLVALVVALASPARRSAWVLAWRTILLAGATTLWWVLPVVLTLVSRARITADTDPFAWSWTHERSSLANVLRLVPEWSWPRPVYFPYAASVERPILIALAFLPALLTLASPFVTRRRARRAAIAAATLALVCGFLAKGLHPPASSVNAWLYRHVPGMWLFREPQTKFSVVMAASFAVGVTCFVGALPRRRSVAAAAIVIVVALTTTFPIWTGRVIPTERPLLPSARVEIPPYWPRTSRFVDGFATRVLLLPADDYYQMPYVWGYYGVDAVAREFLRASPVVLIDPRGNTYLDPDPEAQELLTALRRAIEAREWRQVAVLVRALAIDAIIVRRDVDPHFPDRAIDNPIRLSRGLLRAREFRLLASIGKLDVFAPRSPRARVWATTALTVGSSTHAITALLASSVPVDVAVVDRASTVSSGSPPALRTRRENPTVYRVDVRDASGPFLLVLDDTFDRWWRLENAPRAHHVRVNGYANGWVVDGRGNLELRLVFGPQRLVDFGRRASFVGFALALFLVARAALRRAPKPHGPINGGAATAGGP